MSRGRGRGRVRFGGSGNSGLSDVLDNTREELGLSYHQMEQFQAEDGAALFPPLELPQPEALSKQDASLVHRQRVLGHKLQNLYDTEVDIHGHATGNGMVHVTTPETIKPDEVFVPVELQSSSYSRSRLSGKLDASGRPMQVRNAESLMKSLEAQERKQGEKAKADQDLDDDDVEEDEDLGDDNNDYTVDYFDSDADSQSGDEEVFF